MTHSPKPEDRLFDGDCCCLCGRYNECDTAGDHPCPAFKYCHSCRKEFGGRDVTYKTVVGVHAEYLRRRALAANPPKVEMYGTQPDVLPETLPAGTRFSCDGTSLEFSFTDTAHLDGSDRPGYHGPYICDGRHTPSGLAWPRNIYWSTVPKPASHPSEKPSAATEPCELCGAASRNSPNAPSLKHRTVDGVESPACEAHWRQYNDPQFIAAVREKRREKPREVKADPCSHTRVFPSGICVSCGELRPVAHDAGYAITAEKETHGEAADRRRRVELERSRVACSHPSVPDALPLTGCPDCGMTRGHLAALKNEPGAGIGGHHALSRRVQVDSLLRDMGRPMVRRDRIGREVVPWVGWVSTTHAREVK